MTVGSQPLPLDVLIQATLADLRIAREVNPNHPEPNPEHPHVGCDVCTFAKRLDWQLSRITQTEEPTC